MRSIRLYDTVIRDDGFGVAGLNLEMNAHIKPNPQEFRGAVFSVVSQLFEQRRPPAAHIICRILPPL